MVHLLNITIRNRILMAKNQIKIHPEFRLNGLDYSKSELKALAYDLVKEGKPFEQKIGNFLSDWLNENATLEVKTSGSTGTPKNIFIRKQHMVNSALATGEYFDLKEGNTTLLCLPADYIAGKMMLVRAMVLGLALDYVEPSSSPLNSISKSYDFVAMVPLQLEQSLQQIDLVDTLIVGGAAVSAQLKAQLQNKRVVVYETYGMTETITHVAVRNVMTSGVEAQTRSHFKALPNVTFSIDDRGCLVIVAPKVSDSPVITNDVVHLISKTAFILLGRFDNVINSGGVKLFPEQIEAKLAPFLSNRFFVTGMPDKKLGQKLVLIVEGEINASKLMQNFEEEAHLGPFEIPKNVYMLPKFLETETRKIRRIENLLLITK